MIYAHVAYYIFVYDKRVAEKYSSATVRLIRTIHLLFVVYNRPTYYYAQAKTLIRNAEIKSQRNVTFFKKTLTLRHFLKRLIEDIDRVKRQAAPWLYYCVKCK